MPTRLLPRAHDETVSEDDPAMPESPRQRTLSAEYKLATIKAYDAGVSDGGKGARLRREGIHSSHIVEKRRAGDPNRKVRSCPRTAKVNVT